MRRALWLGGAVVLVLAAFLLWSRYAVDGDRLMEDFNVSDQ